jgi:hypothetical protein
MMTLALYFRSIQKFLNLRWGILAISTFLFAVFVHDRPHAIIIIGLTNLIYAFMLAGETIRDFRLVHYYGIMLPDSDSRVQYDSCMWPFLIFNVGFSFGYFIIIFFVNLNLFLSNLSKKVPLIPVFPFVILFLLTQVIGICMLKRLHGGRHPARS